MPLIHSFVLASVAPALHSLLSFLNHRLYHSLERVANFEYYSICSQIPSDKATYYNNLRQSNS